MDKKLDKSSSNKFINKDNQEVAPGKKIVTLLAPRTILNSSFCLIPDHCQYYPTTPNNTGPTIMKVVASVCM